MAFLAAVFLSMPTGALAQCASSNTISPVTILNEQNSVPNSRQLVNGTNSAVDTSTPGQVKIDVTSTQAQNVRLYLSSGAPTADVTNDTSNFYVGPYGGGNVVTMPDATGNNFTSLSFSEIATALPAQIFRLMDVFIYNNSGAVAVTTSYWDSSQTTGTITGATAANPCVLTSANSLPVGGGYYIGIANITGTMGTTASNGLNGKVFKVASATSTTITLETGVNTTGLSYTSGGNWYLIPTTRTTGLTYQNGCYLQTGNLNYLYVGTMMVGAKGTSARADDNSSARCVWNYFNRIPKYMTCADSTSSWTYTTATFRPRNNSTAIGTGRTEFVIGVAEEPISASVSVVMKNATANVNANNAVGLNSVSGSATSGSSLFCSELLCSPNAGTTVTAGTGQGAIVPAIGYSFAQIVEESVATGTTTFQGTGFAAISNNAATDFIFGRW